MAAPAVVLRTAVSLRVAFSWRRADAQGPAAAPVTPAAKGSERAAPLESCAPGGRKLYGRPDVFLHRPARADGRPGRPPNRFAPLGSPTGLDRFWTGIVFVSVCTTALACTPTAWTARQSCRFADQADGARSLSLPNGTTTPAARAPRRTGRCAGLPVLFLSPRPLLVFVGFQGARPLVAGFPKGCATVPLGPGVRGLGRPRDSAQRELMARRGRTRTAR